MQTWLLFFFFFFPFLMLQQHQPRAAMETLESGMLSLGVRCQHLLRLLTTAEMTFLEPWQQVLPLPPPSPQFQLQSLVLPQRTCLTWWGRLSPSRPPRALTLAWAAHRVWAPQSCPSLGHRYAWLHSYTHVIFFFFLNNSLIYISLQDTWRTPSCVLQQFGDRVWSDISLRNANFRLSNDSWIRQKLKPTDSLLSL